MILSLSHVCNSWNHLTFGDALLSTSGERVHAWTIVLTTLTLAFEPVLLAQASDELLAEYGELCVKRGILGSVLMLASVMSTSLTDSAAAIYRPS